MTPLFSVVLIARNETKTLPRLVESLRQFQERSGEIVLVDTGSTDGTADLARSLGCKVTEVGERFLMTVSEEMADQINARFVCDGELPVVKAGDRLFDYSAARNLAASLSSSDLCAMPDCDEIYSRFDLDAINRVIAEGAEQLEYNFVFSHDEFGNEAIKFLHCKFYDRRKLKWVGVVHEILSGVAKRVLLPETICKLEHWQNPSDHRTRYLTGLAVDCFLNPDNDRNSHYLAREMLWTGRPKSALKEFERHMAMNRWPAEKAQSRIFTGDALINLGRVDEGLAAYHEATLVDCSRREAWIRLAEYFWKKGDHQRTACYASASLAITTSGFYADNNAHYSHLPHEMLYWALWYLGDKEGSRHHFAKAMQYQPKNPKYLAETVFFK